MQNGQIVPFGRALLIVDAAYLATMNAGVVAAVAYLQALRNSTRLYRPATEEQDSQSMVVKLQNASRWLHLGDCLLMSIFMSILLDSIISVLAVYDLHLVVICALFAISLTSFLLAFLYHTICFLRR